jgi:hypothetical protein
LYVVSFFHFSLKLMSAVVRVSLSTRKYFFPKGLDDIDRDTTQYPIFSDGREKKQVSSYCHS